ncbi:MAG: hypothetical protein ACREDF_11970 [Thermoplasmata archaeon]
MAKIPLDTADMDEIREAASWGVLDRETRDLIAVTGYRSGRPG